MPEYPSARFLLNEADLVAANQAHLRWQMLRPDRPWMMWVVIALIVLLLVLSTASAFLGDPSTLITIVVGFATIALLGVVVYRWVVPATARRNFRSTAAFVREIEFSWDGVGFRLQSTHETANIPWNELSALRSTPEALLLYRSPRMHLIIPRRALAGGEADAIVSAYGEAARSG